ncbi:MAG: DUF2029 domain-containing protein [Sphingobacteriia bacterium]|nr:DUF2029 domain-containing protein [Sphingobacteriia bacterium]
MTTPIQSKFRLENFIYNKNIALALWFGLAFIGIVLELSHDTPPNNYLIFKGVFQHTLHQTNLFLEYPKEYSDVNHYGPTFSLIIAPFAMLPDYIGCTLWVLFNAFFLYKAIRSLPINEKYQNAILILASHELLLSSEWQQSNAMICACIILGFSFIQKGKDFIALFFILLATFIKLYGIVGFAFFFFSKDKLKFIIWAAIWSIILFVAPMLITKPSFIVQSYADWYHELVFKAAKNVRLDINNDYQDISVMGMIRRVLGFTHFKNYLITIPAVCIFFSQYLQWNYFKDIRFRVYLLCLVLIMTVIYTTSAESPTYIIAFPAVCIWYMLQANKKWINIVFIFALLLTSFSYSDLFTPYVRDHIIRPYSLKALPCFIIWIIIVVQMWKKQFLSIDEKKFTTAVNG